MCMQEALGLLWELTPVRSEGSKIGQKHTLGCDTVTAKASANTVGNLELR